MRLLLFAELRLALSFRPAAGFRASLLGGVLSGPIIIPILSVLARSNELVRFELPAGCLAEFEGGVTLFLFCTLSIIDLLRLVEIELFCLWFVELFVWFSILLPMLELKPELMRLFELSAGRCTCV